MVDYSQRLRATAFALLWACLASTTQSFFAITRTVCCQSFIPSSVTMNVRCAPHDQNRRVGRTRVTRMEAGQGMGAPGRGMGGRGRGGRGGRGRGKGGRKTSNQGSLIPGPPRLENVPEHKLDEIFVFREEKPGRVPRVIECYADRLAVVGGRRYMIGHPCDWAVSICIPKGPDGVEAVPLDSELMEELLPGLQRELELEDIHLFDTPVTLTLQGEFLDEGEDYEDDDEEYEEEEEEEELEPTKSGRMMYGDEMVDFEVVEVGNGSYVEEEDDDEEVEERIPSEIDEEGVELIVSYWHEDKEYALVKHVDPTFIIARQRKSGYHLLGPREAAVVKPKVEELMLQELQLKGVVEKFVGREALEQQLDAAFEKAGGENADLTKGFPDEIQPEEIAMKLLEGAELATDSSSP